MSREDQVKYTLSMQEQPSSSYQDGFADGYSRAWQECWDYFREMTKEVTTENKPDDLGQCICTHPYTTATGMCANCGKKSV